MKYTLHRLALINYGLYTDRDKTFETEIGVGTHVWAFASVQPGARIGENCTIGEAVHIGPIVVVGNRCKIQNGAQLFEGVTLEDDVFVGPHVVFTNIITPRAFIDRKVEFKPTLVKRGASIGANATIICGIIIGEYAMIGAGAVVAKNVAPHDIVVGAPAEHLGWACRCGVRLAVERNNPAVDPKKTGRVLCPCGTIVQAVYARLHPYNVTSVSIVEESSDAEIP